MKTLYLTIAAALTLLASSLATVWAVDVDAEIDITLQPLEVLVLEGTNAMGK